jgi:hypothetical protein
MVKGDRELTAGRGPVTGEWEVPPAAGNTA